MASEQMKEVINITEEIKQRQKKEMINETKISFEEENAGRT